MAENNSSATLKTAEGAAHPHLIALRTIAEYPATDSLMNMDAANMRRIAARALEAQTSRAEGVPCGICGADEAFTGPCGGGRSNPRALCFERAAQAAPAAVAAPTSHFDDPCVQSVYNILCSGEAPPNGEHWEGFVARRIVDALATPSLPTTGQVLAITTAYEQGVGKGHDAHQRGAEIANPYCTSNYQCFEAWRLGYEEGKRQAERKAEVPNKTVAGDYPHEQMDALALAHYKVVPSDQSMFWRHAVVAGDGQRHLYNGSEVDCQNMARKFAGAFLDGAFAFHATQQTPAEVQAEPVMIYHGRCTIDCGEHGHHDVEMLKMIPAGATLYTAPRAQQMVPEGWREQFAQAVYADLAAADNQDVPLEEYPGRILKVLDSIVGPRHPTVVHWRNDTIRACIEIVKRYGGGATAYQERDMAALYTAPQAQPADALDAPVAWPSGVAQFTKKPVTISAIQWTGKNLREVIAFTDGPPDTRTMHAEMAWDDYANLVMHEGLKIHTLEGKMLANVGDWIIRGVKGEHYPCKPDIFAATYEQATAPQAKPADALDAKRWQYAMDWDTKGFAVCRRVGSTGQCWEPIKNNGSIDAAMAAAQEGGNAAKEA